MTRHVFLEPVRGLEQRLHHGPIVMALDPILDAEIQSLALRHRHEIASHKAMRAAALWIATYLAGIGDDMRLDGGHAP